MFDNTYLVVHESSDVGTIHLVPSCLSNIILQKRLEFLVEKSTTAQSTFTESFLAMFVGLSVHITPAFTLDTLRY